MITKGYCPNRIVSVIIPSFDKILCIPFWAMTLARFELTVSCVRGRRP